MAVLPVSSCSLASSVHHRQIHWTAMAFILQKLLLGFGGRVRRVDRHGDRGDLIVLQLIGGVGPRPGQVDTFAFG